MLKPIGRAQRIVHDARQLRKGALHQTAALVQLHIVVPALGQELEQTERRIDGRPERRLDVRIVQHSGGQPVQFRAILRPDLLQRGAEAVRHLPFDVERCEIGVGHRDAGVQEGVALALRPEVDVAVGFELHKFIVEVQDGESDENCILVHFNDCGTLHGIGMQHLLDQLV